MRWKLQWLPVGIIVSELFFLVFYFLAIENYPGGTNFDVTTIGFSWRYNFWCDLTNVHADNGLFNSARPFAITAMSIFAICMTLFWYQNFLEYKKHFATKIMFFSGIVSVLGLVWVLTDFHDISGVIAGAGAGVAILTLTTILADLKKRKSAWMGLLIVLLICVNIVIFDTGYFLSFLPLIQKCTLGIFLIWILTVTSFSARERG